MTKFTIANAEIFDTTLGGFKTGNITVENGVITGISENGSQTSGEIIDGRGKYVIPGMVDVHTHGRANADFTNVTEEEVMRMCRSYAEIGTTTILGTLATETYETMKKSVAVTVGMIDSVRGKGANIGGIHIEGRYLNVKRKGAHNPDLLKPLNSAEITEMLAPAVNYKEKLANHVTVAPELEGGEEFVKTVVKLGATVGIGHSDSTYDEAMAALGWGATSFTHTFNAMRPLHHREPGTVGAALTSDAYAEVIADGFHLNPAIVKLVYLSKSKDKMVLITDSMMATGCADGEYSIAGLPVHVKGGKALGDDGTISGSTLNLLDGLFNMAGFCGITMEEALPYATINPAKMVGLDGICGSLEVGKRADMLLLSSDKRTLESVYCAGSKIK